MQFVLCNFLTEPKTALIDFPEETVTIVLKSLKAFKNNMSFKQHINKLLLLIILRILKTVASVARKIHFYDEQ